MGKQTNVPTTPNRVKKNTKPNITSPISYVPTTPINYYPTTPISLSLLPSDTNIASPTSYLPTTPINYVPTTPISHLPTTPIRDYSPFSPPNELDIE